MVEECSSMPELESQSMINPPQARVYVNLPHFGSRKKNSCRFSKEIKSLAENFRRNSALFSLHLAEYTHLIGMID
jgi:hypothetical protein